MRVYKFRAICNDADYGNEEYYLKMIYSETINQIAFGDEVDEVRLLVDGKWLIVKSETVGLYTGIKDKNGTEIYEGDIVKCGYFTGVVEYRKNAGIYVIGNKKLEKCITFFDIHMSIGKVEVKGNTYENPELLEGRE